MESELGNILLGLAGVILSLAFSYIPALKTWYDAQENKGVLMLAFVFVLAAAYFGMGCVPVLASFFKIAVSCDVPGALQLVQALISIAVGNQLAYLFTRKGTRK